MPPPENGWDTVLPMRLSTRNVAGGKVAARYAGFIHCCSVWKRQPDSSMISDWMSFPAAAESWSILWMGARSRP